MHEYNKIPISSILCPFLVDSLDLLCEAFISNLRVIIFQLVCIGLKLKRSREILG